IFNTNVKTLFQLTKQLFRFYIQNVCLLEQTIRNMTLLGEILAKRSVNKSMVARRTGLSKARMNELTLTPTAKLRADELYLIAKAIDMEPCDLLNALCGHLALKAAN